MPTSPADAARLTLKATWEIPGSAARLPIDPIYIARQLNIEVFLADLGRGISGQLQKRAGKPAQIYLSRDDSINRQRFTCAHECGHYVRRTPELDDEFEFVDRRDWRSSLGTQAEEIWANQFAAELLMPEKDVRSHWEAGYRAIELLSDRFAVSDQAMDLRLRNLRLTP